MMSIVFYEKMCFLYYFAFLCNVMSTSQMLSNFMRAGT